MLEHFGMQGVKLVSILLVAYFKLSSVSSPKTKEKREHMSYVPYTSIVRSIMYVMVYTRPDISHVISMLNRYMDHLEKIH